MSLRGRILLLVLLATLGPALAVGLYLFGERGREIERAKHDLGALAKYAAENLDDKIKGTVQLLHGLSRAPDLDTSDTSACSMFLEGVLGRYPQYTGLLTVTPDGDLHCDSLRSGRKLNVSARDYFKQVRTSLEPAFDVVIGGLTGIAVLQAAYPVLDERGALKYVLLASLNLSEYARGFVAASHHAGLRMLVWNRTGTLMARQPAPAGDALVGKNFADSQLFRFTATAKTGAAAELPDLNGPPRVWAVGVLPAPSGGGARITLGIEREVLVAHADKALRNALEVLAGVSLLAFAGAWFVAEVGIRRQVQRIAGVARRVGEGELGARIGAPYPPGELGELMAVVDRTAGAVQAQQAEIASRSRDLQRVNRTLRVLSGINSLIVRARDRDELFREACRIAVDEGGFRMSLICIVDRSAMKIVPVASAGKNEGIMTLMESIVPNEDAPRTMVARAIRDKKPVVSNDARADRHVLFGSNYSESGVCSMAVLPLIIADEATGVIALYSDEIEFFQEAEMKLLRELAGDISFALEHIENSEKLAYLAYYDPLTGLPNRSLYLERLGQCLEGAANGEQVVVLLGDIKRLRVINETLGRPAGDEILKQIAGRLAKVVRHPESLARIAADCFATFIPKIKDLTSVAHSIEALRVESLRAPFLVAGRELNVAYTLAAAVFPGDGKDAESLLANAEATLRKAKAGGDSLLFYESSINARVAESLELENKLRRALEKEQFVLHYQPKIELGSGNICGVEALIRWNDPETGLVPPIKFIPLLEETGLILAVGRWAIQQALRDYREWSERGLRPPRIAVNVSPIQLRQRDFVEVVREAIGPAIGSHGLDLEITESLIMEDMEGNISKLRAIRDMGVDIAIDDFGTGYSSLAYLAKLPVTALKIDRSFIISMASEPDNMTIVSTIISLAHSLHLTVIAEGVDAEDQKKLLRLLRCDAMQGYLFSKPLPAAAMEALLSRERSI
jgi:diguanylate cyclase (GGDEF)-like protein